MMHSFPTAVAPPLPPMRDKLPTPAYDLREFAQQSSLPDADDDLVFTAGPALSEFHSRIPRLASTVGQDEALTARESLLLSLVDGLSPVSMLVELLGGDPDESLVVLCDLYARGFVAFDGAD
jgi:hypothetical protein